MPFLPSRLGPALALVPKIVEYVPVRGSLIAGRGAAATEMSWAIEHDQRWSTFLTPKLMVTSKLIFDGTQMEQRVADSNCLLVEVEVYRTPRLVANIRHGQAELWHYVPGTWEEWLAEEFRARAS